MVTERDGGWALVTGASSGIGQAVAHALAADGRDVFLLAEDPAGLEHVRGEIAAAHDVAVQALCVDLARPRAAARIAAALGDRDVGVLVACGGPPVLELLPRLAQRGRGALVYVSSMNVRAAGTTAFELTLASGTRDVDVRLVLPAPGVMPEAVAAAALAA